MQISCLPSSDRQTVMTIFCDGVPWRKLHTSIFGRHPNLPQECHSLQEFSHEFSVLEYRQAKSYALRRLSLQGMLSAALVRSLKERLVSQTTIERVLQDLCELGLINDDEWAASFIRTQQLKKFGPRAIAQKLANKGIKRETLQLALEQSASFDDQKTAILKLLQSRYSKRGLSDFKEKRKVVASLVRRGFDLTLVLNCMAHQGDIDDGY